MDGVILHKFAKRAYSLYIDLNTLSTPVINSRNLIGYKDITTDMTEGPFAKMLFTTRLF